MKITKIFLTLWRQTIESIQNFLVPEDKRIEQLLKMDTQTMRLLLPKSVVNSPDIFVLFDYGNKIVRLIVKSIKYKNNMNLRRRVAKYLHEEILDFSSESALFEGKLPILTPIPMTKKETQKRGFNQCEELCREIKKFGGESVNLSLNCLKKTRETRRQADLTREERLLNVKNSMEAETSVRGKTVMVLDDVYTTGSTMEEARRALLSAGAKRVVNIFIAH